MKATPVCYECTALVGSVCWNILICSNQYKMSGLGKPANTSYGLRQIKQTLSFFMYGQETKKIHGIPNPGERENTAYG